MYIEVQSLINSLFIKLLEGKVKFSFVSIMFAFLQNPKSEDLFLIAKFNENSYNLFKKDVEEIRPILIENSQKNVGYKTAILNLIAETLCDYNYTFQDKNENIVQSNLIFLLIKSLSKSCISEMIDFICHNELGEVLSKPQIHSSSFIFSSILHNLLEKGYDEIALKAAINFENKTMLFAKNFEGLTPSEVALQKNCKLSAEYIQKVREISEMVELKIPN